MERTKQQESEMLDRQVKEWLSAGNKITQVQPWESGLKEFSMPQPDRAVRDLTGEQFGRLTVLHRSKNPTMKNHWMCECKCGKQQLIETPMLLNGKSLSCSECKKAERIKKEKVQKKRGVNLQRLRKKGYDIAGHRFGRLVAVKIAETNDGIRRWVCKCDCGRERLAPTAKLRNGYIKNCGEC